MLPFALWIAAGCTGPSYNEARRLDTIEAYEAFLEADPDSAYRYAVKKRLGELYRDKALSRHAELAWNDVLSDGSLGAIQAYLDEFGKADRAIARRARGMVDALQYATLELSPPRVEKVNLAEDPKGPLNGWGVSVDVKNAGTEKLYYVQLSVQWATPDGAPIETHDFLLVSDRWFMPATDEQRTPIEPGETRTWKGTQDFERLPEEPTPTARVFPTGLRTRPTR
jgi:hypothetical protein